MYISRRNILFLLGFFAIKLKAKEVDLKGSPYRDRFQSYRQTFRIKPDREEAIRIMKNIINGRDIKEGLIEMSLPDIAEDGNVVPLNFKINCEMTEEDYPKKVHVLALDNPFPEVAIFKFSPYNGEAKISFRIRMRGSSEVVVISEMIDGTVGLSKQYVEVMLGACS